MRQQQTTIRERTKAWLCSASAISLVALAGCSTSSNDWMDTILGERRPPQEVDGARRAPALNPGGRGGVVLDPEQNEAQGKPGKPYSANDPTADHYAAHYGEDEKQQGGDGTMDRWFGWLKKPEASAAVPSADVSEAARMRAQRKPLPGNIAATTAKVESQPPVEIKSVSEPEQKSAAIAQMEEDLRIEAAAAAEVKPEVKEEAKDEEPGFFARLLTKPKPEAEPVIDTSVEITSTEPEIPPYIPFGPPSPPLELKKEKAKPVKVAKAKPAKPKEEAKAEPKNETPAEPPKEVAKETPAEAPKEQAAAPQPERAVETEARMLKPVIVQTPPGEEISLDKAPPPPPVVTKPETKAENNPPKKQAKKESKKEVKVSQKKEPRKAPKLAAKQTESKPAEQIAEKKPAKDIDAPVDLSPSVASASPFPWLDDGSLRVQPEAPVKTAQAEPAAAKVEKDKGMLGKMRSWLTRPADAAPALTEPPPAAIEAKDVQVVLKPQAYQEEKVAETKTLESRYPDLRDVPKKPAALTKAQRNQAKKVADLKKSWNKAQAQKKALDADPEPGSFAKEVAQGATKAPAGNQLPAGVKDTDLEKDAPAPAPVKTDAKAIVNAREEETVSVAPTAPSMHYQSKISGGLQELPWKQAAAPAPKSVQEEVVLASAEPELTVPPPQSVMPPAAPAKVAAPVEPAPEPVAQAAVPVPAVSPFQRGQSATAATPKPRPAPVAAPTAVPGPASRPQAVAAPVTAEIPPPPAAPKAAPAAPVALASDIARPYTSAQVQFLPESRYAERRRMLAMRRTKLSNH